MIKIVNWMSTIFCVFLATFYSIVVIGIFNLPVDTHRVASLIFWIGVILSPIILLTCGVFYLLFVFQKRKTNVIIIIATILLFIAFVIWLLLFIFSIIRAGTLFGFHGGIAVLGAGLIIYGFPLYVGFPMLQFILTLIGFLTSKKEITTVII